MPTATVLYEQAKVEAYGRAAQREFQEFVELNKDGSVTFHFSDGILQKINTQEYKKPKLTNLEIV